MSWLGAVFWIFWAVCGLWGLVAMADFALFVGFWLWRRGGRRGEARVPRSEIADWKKRRQMVAQSFRCMGCWRLLDWDCQLDHIVPLYAMGADDERNWQTLCSACHNKKSATDLQRHPRAARHR